MNAAVTLRKAGLSPSQAALLVTLVERDGPATSATLAKESGVPRTSVYTVADSLIDMGLIRTRSVTTGAMQWEALGWGITCARLRAHLEANLAEQVEAIAGLAYTAAGLA